MAKKTKKQLGIEKRIKELKTQHGTLSKQKLKLKKRIDRERDVRDKELSRIELAQEKLQEQWQKLDAKDLPSTKTIHRITERLVALEDKIREQEGKLRALNEPPPSDAKRAHEAGDEEE